MTVQYLKEGPNERLDSVKSRLSPSGAETEPAWERTREEGREDGDREGGMNRSVGTGQIEEEEGRGEGEKTPWEDKRVEGEDYG